MRQFSNLSKNLEKVSNENAKPFIKWAGGKTQLLPQISQKYPSELGTKIRHYAEAFVGGGAVFFDLYQKNLIDFAILVDCNYALVNLYRTIQKTPQFLIESLSEIEHRYLSLDEIDREKFYYSKRDSFNTHDKTSKNSLYYASEFIFLNRTCFNGLFRVNKKGLFNVPFGRYKNPTICNKNNIFAVSNALQIAEIIQGDFTQIKDKVSESFFVYYDPPYRPLTLTSNFNAYSGEFLDHDQIRLAEFYKYLNEQKISQMLSNSDPKTATGDEFFDRLYNSFNIERVFAKRMINANPDKRGNIAELLITNYKYVL